MCDPASLAIASTIATGVGAAGSIVTGLQAANAQKKQQREVVAWQREQQKNRQMEQIRQESLRQGAEQSRQTTVEQLSAEQQQKAQADEEARLATYLQGDQQQATPEAATPVSEADKNLLTSTSSSTFRSDLAAAINNATKGARERMKSLAGISSYGESFGGMGTKAQEALQAGGRDINMFNEFRRGSLGAFGVESNVDPVEINQQPNPLASIFSTALQWGAQGLGNRAGTPSTVFPKAPPASKFIGPPVPIPAKYNPGVGHLF
jgi:hypothetical protein